MSALVAVCLAPLQGSTLQQLSLTDMITKSTAIVYGKVLPSYSSFRGAMIYTHYRVVVNTTYKGTQTKFWDLAVPGGVVNGTQQSFAGVPSLATGQSYLLFLWTSKTGLTQVIGLSQGLFNVTTDASGQLEVSRGASGETMLNNSGQVINDSAVNMSLIQMRGRIQAVLSGGVGQ